MWMHNRHKKKIYYDFKKEYEQSKKIFGEIVDTEEEVKFLIELCESGSICPLPSSEVIRIHEKLVKLSTEGTRVLCRNTKKFGKVTNLELIYNPVGLLKNSSVTITFDDDSVGLYCSDETMNPFVTRFIEDLVIVEDNNIKELEALYID